MIKVGTRKAQRAITLHSQESALQEFGSTISANRISNNGEHDKLILTLLDRTASVIRCGFGQHTCEIRRPTVLVNGGASRTGDTRMRLRPIRSTWRLRAIPYGTSTSAYEAGSNRRTIQLPGLYSRPSPLSATSRCRV